MATRSKLAVILHADVVGSTALVQKDERVAHDRIRDTFRRFFEVISRYGGITHEVRGDALVAEFGRASDAVCASLAFQKWHREQGGSPVDEIRLQVRIGVALGEDVDTIRAQDDANFGMRYDAPSDKPSIAVLPFRNLSSDPEQAYFSDGITEDIITTLSRISGLIVIARQSTAVYKGKSVDVAHVSRDQGVRYVLEGSVRSAANRVRITTQLVDASNERHVWGERYDRALEDVFSVQDEITRRIVIELQVQLTEGEQARAWSGGTESLEAWKQIVRASELLSSNVKENTLEARKLADLALALDPALVSARTVLGWTYWQEARHGWGRSPELSTEKMSKAAEAALEFESENPDGLALLGASYLLKGDFDRAVETYERAIHLAPNHSWIAAMSALVLLYSGTPQESIPRIEKAMRLSPICPMWFLVVLGHAHRMVGNFEQAIEAFEKARHREAESLGPRVGLVASLSEAGRMEEAESAARELLRLAPRFSVTDWMRTRPFKESEQREQLHRSLTAAGLPD